MHVVFAMLMIALCLGCIAFAARSFSVHSLFLGTMALFSIGYYGLPMLLVERSTLRYVPEADVIAVIGMALLFMTFLVLGVVLVMTKLRPQHGFFLPVIDTMMERHWWPFAVVTNAIIIYYMSTRAITIYQVENIQDYYDSRSSIAGFVGFISGIAQAAAAVYLVRALPTRNWLKIGFSVGCLLVQLYLASKGANRLMFITPLLLVLGAMVANGNYRMAGITLASTVGALLVFSPIAVAMRSGSWNSTQDIQAESFDYGDDPFDTMLQSIIDRGDILYNMATLKSYVDRHGTVGWTYYWSVLSIPIPRYFYPQKPSVLSEDGTRDTEISILAWHLIVGPSTGSLTAFGSIVAYREGGWAWIPINALLAGAMYAYLLTVFSRGGLMAQAFAAFSFTQWSVRKVPPSFTEAMVDIMTYLPVIIGLIVLERLLRGDRLGLQMSGSDDPSARPAATA